MRLGIFEIPYSLDYETGGIALADIIEYGLRTTEWAEAYGFDIAFYAEHFTIGREPSPSPDAMIAAAAQRTRRIRLGALGHLLPYHDPRELAHRLLFLDHMTRGRFTAGFAPGAFPSDAQLFGTQGKNREMATEALDIILKIWTEPPPFRFDGRFWTVDMPPFDETWQGPHLKPLQAPHPPIVMTGSQATSPTLAEAGRRGLWPLSNGMATDVQREHWRTYRDAALAAGHAPRRADWFVCRNFMVADTDEAAFDLAVNGEMGRLWREHQLGLTRKLGLLGQLLPGVEPDEVTVDALARDLWLVGSPTTVAAKVERLYEALGGFGTLVTVTYNYGDRSDEYRRSFELMGTEVLPRLAHLTGDEPA